MANTGQSGYLSNTDWNTFNNKQTALSFGNLTETSSSILTIAGGTGAVIGSGTTIAVKQSSSTQSGYLSSTDWTTFNSKQAQINGTGFVKATGTTISYDNNTYYLASNPSSYITLASLSGTTPISYNSGTGAISIALANTSTSGYLSSTDWNTFNSKASLTAFSASPPLSYNSGTGAFSITQSSGSTNGYLSSTDWTTFNSKQSALTNPVTGTGTLNTIVKFTATGTTVGNSTITDNGTSVTFSTALSGTSATFSGTTAVASAGGTSQMRIDRSGSVARIQNYDGGSSANISIAWDGGNIGFGTIAPVTNLDVQAAIAGAYTTSSSQAPVRIFNITNAGGINSSVLSFQASTDNSASNPVARIGVAGESAGSNNGALIMMTRDGSGVTERVRITSAGIMNTTTRVNVNGSTDNSLFSLNSGGTLYTTGFSPNATANSTNTLTLTTAQTTWIYNGSGVATWTLFNPSGTNQMIWIKNAGTGIITLNAYSGTNIINNAGASVSSITIAIGATVLIQQDGNVKSYQLQ